MTIWGFISDFIAAYQYFISTLPSGLQIFINLFVLVVFIVLYSVFIWKIHKFIAVKNIFKFDLSKYNTATHPILTKLIASSFYLLEYIIIIPFIIFLAYTIFTFFLIWFLKDIPVGDILLVSAIAIASIRMAAYIPKYGENLARKISEIFSFSILAFAVLSPQIFVNLMDKTAERFSEIPSFSSEILSYLMFMIILEIVLRVFEFLFTIIGIDDPLKESVLKKK